jgi:methylenetetrahydrofolate reductase (NADPH)
MTQMFFDNAHYLRYLDRARVRGIGIPVVPGIFPIHSFEAVARFARRCGASIPAHVAARFEDVDPDSARAREVAADLAAEQVVELAEAGVDHVHLYTLNRADLALAVCERLGVCTRESEAA